MNRIRFLDVNSTIQVIGNVYKNPSLLNTSNLTSEDFPKDFYKIVYGTFYKLFFENGLTRFTDDVILDFIEARPQANGVFKENGGIEFIHKAAEIASEDSYSYYYDRLKKMTLLRAYSTIGLDVSEFYDEDNILDTKKRQEQEDWLDSNTLFSIGEAINNKVEYVYNKYANDSADMSCAAGEGIIDLIEELKTSPAYGYPFYDNLVTAVTMGARLGKYYLRSSKSGFGKTRTLAQDASYTSIAEYYDVKRNEWITNPAPQPTLFIATEQARDEIQTLLLAFVAGVDEAKILTATYSQDEYQRLLKAADLIQAAPLRLEFMPDYSMQDVERVIKYNILEHNISYIYFDYLQSTMKILAEISSQAKVKIREDQILFLLSTKLKDIAVKYNVFIETSTQLSGDLDTDTPDQRLLRGGFRPIIPYLINQ